MPDVLIRDVPADDLAEVRAAATAQGRSLQSYLRETVQAQADHLRRQAALARAADRLAGREGVPDDERAAVLDAIEAEHADRAARLGDQSAR